ncbi:MAG: tetratricopeptide repeat protein [Alphaproteobacteria bacterium]|nr:tetratricopeptide repeat protein [Alphaproteobacteria bacterium]
MAESDELYHEISEELRQQELKAFWRENGAWIIGGVVAAIVLTGGISFWRVYEAKQNMRMTSVLLEAASKADPAALTARAPELGKKHATYARFEAAAAYAAAGDRDKAVKTWIEISKGGGEKVWRDLALLKAASAQLDDGDPAWLRKTLKDLSAEKNWWRFSARELLALLNIRENKVKDAVEGLAVLAADPLTPQDLRTRAMTLHALYAADVEQKR